MPFANKFDGMSLLAVRGHLGFFEHHVASKNGIVLLQLQLALLLLLVLRGVVGESGSFARNQPDIVAHSGRAGTTVPIEAQVGLWRSAKEDARFVGQMQ